MNVLELRYSLESEIRRYYNSKKFAVSDPIVDTIDDEAMLSDRCGTTIRLLDIAFDSESTIDSRLTLEVTSVIPGIVEALKVNFMLYDIYYDADRAEFYANYSVCIISGFVSDGTSHYVIKLPTPPDSPMPVKDIAKGILLTCIVN